MKHIHFLGICGTAMGALASAMARQGYQVSGTDEHAYDPMRSFLLAEGISISEGYQLENLPADVDLYIIGNAIARGNVMLEEIIERGFRYKSLPEAMKEFFLWGKRNFVVTGTHGKTTTSSLLAWLLDSSGRQPSYLIGGLAHNFGRGGHFTDSLYTVLEGDEYDTAYFDKRAKFVHYLPEVVIVNNIEMDHVDIYDSVDEIKRSFLQLLRIVPQKGQVFINADCQHCLSLLEKIPSVVPVAKVGQAEDADIRISDICYSSEGSSFCLNGVRYSIAMTGEFNVYNAAMACCAARVAGMSEEEIRTGLLSFEGIARRQQLRGTARGVHVIDDFAHHPTAIGKAISALRQRYASSRIVALFDPRSNTSASNCFQRELAEALSTADAVCIAPLEKGHRYAEDERLCRDLLKTDIESLSGIDCYLGDSASGIVEYIVPRCEAGDVLLVMSNGGFDAIHEKLLLALEA